MHHLVIDTETTGLSPNFNKTLTVGLLLADIKKTHLNILEHNHIFIKHAHYNPNPQALAVNKINLEHHNLIAVPPYTACNQINTFIEDNSLQQTPLLGHNIAFDKNFLSALFDQAQQQGKLVRNPGFLQFHHQSFDTMQTWRHLRKNGTVPSHLKANLGTIADFFDIDYTKAHDALADCKITAQVYHKMLKII
ncbi:MAG: 3'-5' exonuclease [Nanoarchaeota archaeon]|nr:3'-5' exonuclease [Nanoarchaeota archaeon]